MQTFGGRREGVGKFYGECMSRTGCVVYQHAWGDMVQQANHGGHGTTS